MKLPESLLRDLERIAPIKRQELLGRYTTFGVGGPADVFVVATTGQQLAETLRLCRRTDTPFFVLGSGSNIVVGDRGIRGVTIANQSMRQTDPEWVTNGERRCLVRVDAGCSFAGAARHLAFAGYAGLEWACGIPGTIGGAVVYNAGAYGGCLADVLRRVGIAGEEGDRELAATDLGLVYRGSDFTRGLMSGRAVLWAEVALWPGDARDLKAQVQDYDRRRLAAQPRGRNAGSFFKNPSGQPAWRLIEAAGLRGHHIGGAEFSAKHCNFMINTGQATAADVYALKTLAQVRIRDQFGLELETEVALAGEGFGDD